MTVPTAQELFLKALGDTVLSTSQRAIAGMIGAAETLTPAPPAGPLNELRSAYDAYEAVRTAMEGNSAADPFEVAYDAMVGRARAIKVVAEAEKQAAAEKGRR